ncbi:hypothetical protein N783_11070 [Pontibacillus marinus BH030004 = DSM 16465]|uniref:Uncharacterized protein n=2 Tax=Pontibacillus TaxID=289201 RepID=A0A0A5GGW9_9BACI|nr:hypothetical protein N783_11070 [Pontibacillus marinus BH030004 = DSM 16465]
MQGTVHKIQCDKGESLMKEELGMNFEEKNRRSNQNEEGESGKKREPYFDPSIPDEPLMSDEDTSINASNAKKK